MKIWTRSSLVVLITTIITATPVAISHSASGKGMSFPPTKQGVFAEVERLVGEQKYQAALDQLEAEIGKGRQSGLEQARLLIKRTQLQLGLHGYETALLALRQSKWPTGIEAQALLKIYYIHALREYVDGYGYEIRQREVVDAGTDLDLKKWSLERINREIGNQLWELWKSRLTWGVTEISAAKEFITQNNYPKSVRGTLRDFLTYFWVDFLRNSSFWSPQESNEVHRINIAAEVKSGAVGFADQNQWRSLHPLARAARLLKDLEAWHQNSKRTEAALEAHLVRIKMFLDQHAEAGSRRQMLMKALRQTVISAPQVPWKAKGFYDLAQARSQDSDPEALIEARRWAKQGVIIGRGTQGASLCDYLLKTLEAPHFDVQGMLTDGLGKQSLKVSYKNLSKLYFRAYPIDLAKMATAEKDYNFFPNRRQIQDHMKRNKAPIQWEVVLKPTKDLRSHDRYVVPPIQKKGYYFIVSSANADFEQEESNRVSGIHFIVSDLVLESEQSKDGTWHIRSLNGHSGERMAGVDIRLYQFDWKTGHRLANSYKTDKEGEVRIKGSPSHTYYMFAEKGEDLGLIHNGIHFYESGQRASHEAHLVYLDRSLYRPGQKIFWKVVSFGGKAEEGQLKGFANANLQVSLRDTNHKQVEKVTVKTNEFGTASGEFLVPTGRILGSWHILVQRVSGRGGQAYFQVEEYKRPTFEVTLGESTKAMKVNVKAQVKGEVKYYHGLPVTSGKAQWSVYRQKVFPWWWGWYYWRGGGGGQEQILTAGESNLNDKGEFVIDFVPEGDAEDEKKELSYTYRIQVDVTDEGGETRSTQRSYRVGFVAVQARIQQKENFFDTKARVSLEVNRSSLDGKPLAGKGRYRILRIRQPKKTPMPAEVEKPNSEPHAYQHTDDFRNARWESHYNWKQVLFNWKSGAMVQSGRVKHGNNGLGKILLNPLPPGPYRLEYVTRDRFGKEAKARHDFLVLGKGFKLNLPLVVLPEKNSYQVGEKVKLLVHSGLASQAMNFFIGQDSVKSLREVRRVGNRGSLHEFSLGPEWRGGFFVEAGFVHDFQSVSQTLNVYIPWENKQLQVEYERIRKKMEPGSKEKWVVKVHAPGKKGAIEAGELLAYMYDRSLEAFAPHSPPSILGHFPGKSYNSFPLSYHLYRAPGFSLWGNGWYYGNPVSFHGDYLKEFASYGIGGLGSRGGGGFGGKGRMMYEAEEDVMALADEAAPAAAKPSEAPVLREKAKKESSALGKEDNAVLGQSVGAPKSVEEVPQEQVRKNFSETAFWQPHLRWNKQGQVSLEFQVPDSVTSWKVWAHALTESYQSGTAQATVETVKDLMVRPYLPRFVREGDRASMKIVAQNAGKKKISVVLTAQIEDPTSGKSLLADFGIKQKVWSKTVQVAPGGSASATMDLVVPPNLGMVRVTVKGKSGRMTDGEERPLPVLPSRMHLLQSRFATLRKGKPRELKFPDMAKGDDPSLIHKQLVMTVDAQLLYSVLSALPYLVNYPYECVEQTLNRFVSTAILTEVFGSHPLVKQMATKMAKGRNTQFEKWRADDPNRLLFLEETPWMAEAEGGRAKEDELLKVLDPKVAKNQKESALRKLKDAQTSNGAFPWYPGGQPSPYMTLLVVHGFSKATELGVTLPKDMIVRAWNYLILHIREKPWKDLGVEFLTFLNYVASSYPDDSWTGNFFAPGEREKILDYTFKHWKSIAPMTKAQMALTLQRMKRPQDSKLVFDSIMDSSKTTEDEGTFWAAEDRAWLWYNDTIEGHAYALRAMTELQPTDERRDGLVQWLFLNKKLSHWKSTRATAEVLYALTYYMKQEKQIGIEEKVKLQAGAEKKEFIFKPDDYTGKSKQWVIPGTQIKPKAMSVVKAEKMDPALGFVSATWHFSTEKLPEKGDGDFLKVEREYFVRATQGKRKVLTPLKKGMRIKVGDEVEVHLSLRSKQAMEYVHLRDPRAAGLEPGIALSKWAWDLGLARYEEIRDSATNFFIEWLPAGEYTLKYRVKANMAGRFRVGPARIQAMYAPEFGAYSAGHIIEVQ